MEKLVTPKQVAQAINVSESSLKRWCDQGRLTAIRTVGGHRRLARSEVIQFLRDSGLQLVRPELLGLPSNTGQAARLVERARDRFRDALIADAEDECRRIIFDLYLAGQSLPTICDEVLAPAFHDIGFRWECGDVAVYRERRACEIASKILHEFQAQVKNPCLDAPLAIGGTLECDRYQLPTAMVELVLRQLGWQASSLGASLPAATIVEAIRERRPELFWISISSIDSASQFLEDYALVHRAATEIGAVVVVGGRALTADLRQKIVYSAYCDGLRHLESFVASLKRVGTQG